MRDDVLDHLVPESGRATFEIMSWGLDVNRASEVDADAVTAPLLFLTGSEDRINPPSTVARIAALYGGRATVEGGLIRSSLPVRNRSGALTASASTSLA
jgi:pimeloyl-ACP methyl ester carboxylesterase